MVNIVLCDDNIQFANLLRDVVNKKCKQAFIEEDYSISAVLNNGPSLLQYVESNSVDVILLDIDMPGMNGFDVARILCQSHPSIIIVFMSAYDNFVYSTFEYMPFAYIRKSRMDEELPKVLNRIAEKRQESIRQINISTNDGDKRIDVKSIIYAESKRNYVLIKLVYNKEYSFRGTLTEFEGKVNGFDFYRTHNAFIVNLKHVERIQDDEFVLVNGFQVPVSQRRIKGFRKAYMDYTRRCFVL